MSLPPLPKLGPLGCDYQDDMIYGYTVDEMFALRAATVEACAKVCESVNTRFVSIEAAGDCADAIRGMK
jgi:hypothetical protein